MPGLTIWWDMHCLWWVGATGLFSATCLFLLMIMLLYTTPLCIPAHLCVVVLGAVLNTPPNLDHVASKPSLYSQRGLALFCIIPSVPSRPLPNTLHPQPRTRPLFTSSWPQNKKGEAPQQSKKEESKKNKRARYAADNQKTVLERQQVRCCHRYTQEHNAHTATQGYTSISTAAYSCCREGLTVGPGELAAYGGPAGRLCSVLLLLLLPSEPRHPKFLQNSRKQRFNYVKQPYPCPRIHWVYPPLYTSLCALMTPTGEQERAREQGDDDAMDSDSDGGQGGRGNVDEGMSEDGQSPPEEGGLESEVLKGKNMDVASMDALKKRIEVRKAVARCY